MKPLRLPSTLKLIERVCAVSRIMQCVHVLHVHNVQYIR